MHGDAMPGREKVDLDRLLADLRRNPGGIDLSDPADVDAVARMQADSARDLGRAVPEEYERLLRVTNGLQIGNTFLCAAEDLVPDNLDYARPEVILLGRRGNVDDVVYDPRDRRYALINMGYPDERNAAFERLVDLLIEVMRLEDFL